MLRVQEPNLWAEVVPTWVAAVSTALATVAAIVAARYAVRVFKAGRQQARAAQASLIAGWASEDQGLVVVTVNNASNLPVYHLTAELYHDYSRHGGERTRTIHNDELMPPGKHATVTDVTWQTGFAGESRISINFTTPRGPAGLATGAVA